MNQITCVNHKELVTSTAACFKSSKFFQHSPLCPEHIEELRLIFPQGAQSISIHQYFLERKLKQQSFIQNKYIIILDIFSLFLSSIFLFYILTKDCSLFHFWTPNPLLLHCFPSNKVRLPMDIKKPNCSEIRYPLLH